MSELVDDLIAAKSVIDTPDKWSAEGGGEDGTHCAITACNDLGGVERRCAAYDALWEALPAKYQTSPHRMADVFDFNDDPATTHADVMALFDRAIDAAKAGAA